MRCVGGEFELALARGLDRGCDAPPDRHGAEEDDEQQDRRHENLGEQDRRASIRDAVERLRDDHVAVADLGALDPEVGAGDGRGLRPDDAGEVRRQSRRVRAGEDRAIRGNRPDERRRATGTIAGRPVERAALRRRPLGDPGETLRQALVDLVRQGSRHDRHDRERDEQIRDRHDDGRGEGDPDRLSADRRRAGHASSSR